MKHENLIKNFYIYNSVNKAEMFDFINDCVEESGKRISAEQIFAIMHLFFNGIRYYNERMEPCLKKFDLDTTIRLYCKNHNITVNKLTQNNKIIKIFLT